MISMIPLKWLFIRWFFKYLSPVIKFYEEWLIKKYSSKGINYPPIFIVGAPRSGSTILFQLLTKYFSFVYINNFINMAREVPLTGFVVNKILFKDIKHNSFSSQYGNTQSGGLVAPNEGLFWYKWLPKDKHFVRSKDISVKDKRKMKDCFNAIMNKYEQSIIIKNLSFGLRLELIHKLFPLAKIIVIKRDPFFTCQSIFLSRRKLGIPDNKMWGILPRNFQEMNELNIYEKIVLQVSSINQQIEEDIKNFPKENVYSLTYESLCQNTRAQISEITGFINSGFSLKENFQVQNLKNGNNLKLSRTDELEFKSLIEKHINYAGTNE